MTYHVVLCGVPFCMAALTADKPDRGATANQSVPAQQTLTGCVDEQFGRYVLLDNQMLKITDLHSAGAEKEVFARHVGHKAQSREA